MPSTVDSTYARIPRLAAFAAFVAALVPSLPGSPAHADPPATTSAPSLAGDYTQGPLHETYTVQQWISACGPAPSSSSSGGGQSIAVSQAGAELVFTGGGRTFRTDQCYDPLPTLHVDVHTRDQEGTSWRSHCATSPSDPRRATIQSLVTVNGAREVDISETGRYEITLAEGTCIADIRRSRSFTRVAAPPSTPTPQAPPPRAASVDPGSTCSAPGPAASLEVRPARHSVRAGDRLLLQATVRDAAGCALTSAASAPHFRLTADDEGKITLDDKGVLNVAADAAETTTQVQVTASGVTADADITVISGSHYDELLANGGLDAGTDDPQIIVIAPSELGGEGVRARNASQRRRAWFITIIGGFALALGILALVFQRRTRKAAALEKLALERHEARVRDVENRRGHLRQAHAEQLQAHEESVERAQKATAATAAKATRAGAAGARGYGAVSSASLAAAASNAVPNVVPDLPPPDAALVCTTCRREFPPRGSREGGGGIFCPFDATRLSAISLAAGAPGGPQPAGSVCPSCHRGYPPGVRVCAVDGDELAPVPLVRPSALGARGKICPTCGSRFEGVAAFCGKDGTQLVLLN